MQIVFIVTHYNSELLQKKLVKVGNASFHNNSCENLVNKYTEIS